MEKYSCVLSENGVIRSDLTFKNLNEYFVFIAVNKNRISWAKLINSKNGAILDEYCNLSKIGCSGLPLVVPQYLTGSKLLLINSQQIIWLMMFIEGHTTLTKKTIAKRPLKPFKISSKSEIYDGKEIFGGLALIKEEEFLTMVNKAKREINSNYKNDCFKMLVDPEGIPVYAESTV